MKKLVYLIGVSMALFHVVSLIFYPLTPDVFRSMHLLGVLLIIFLTIPFSKKPRGFGSKIGWANGVLALSGIAACYYACHEMVNMYNKFGIFLNGLDVAMGILCVLLILEATRRTTGWALPVVSIIFILYGLLGQYLPGTLGHNGYSIKRLVFAVYSYDGIFSTPLETCATYVVMFILFSAYLEKTGAGEYFLDLAKAVAGKMRGGPAKVAVLASAFFGMISGSAVANVAGTGCITIPMMKKIGYRAQFAGAVEAVASTGGQIMPPIMAAGAFLMAETLGVSYLSIATAALIPAIMYFLTVWISIDCVSARQNLHGLSAEQVPSAKKLLKEGWYLLLPIVLLIYLLVIVKYSAIKSAFYGMVACIVIAIVDPRRRFTVKDFFDGCYASARSTAGIAGACACAGIVIGIMSLTGLGGKISMMVMSLANGQSWLALILSMLVAVLFGMGLPSTISYLLCVAVLSSVLCGLGIKPLAAHLFIFYYASLSVITPPVALAAYTGAGIAGSKPIPTAFEATKLGIVAFFVPFMFVYNNAYLMHGTVWDVLWACLIGVCTCFALAAFCQGFLTIRLKWTVRVLFGAAAALLFWQTRLMDALGLCAFASLLVLIRLLKRREKKARASVVS